MDFVCLRMGGGLNIMSKYSKFIRNIDYNLFDDLINKMIFKTDKNEIIWKRQCVLTFTKSLPKYYLQSEKYCIVLDYYNSLMGTLIPEDEISREQHQLDYNKSFCISLLVNNTIDSYEFTIDTRDNQNIYKLLDRLLNTVIHQDNTLKSKRINESMKDMLENL